MPTFLCVHSLLCVFVFVCSIHSCTIANNRTSERDFAAASTTTASHCVYQHKPEGTAGPRNDEFRVVYQFALAVVLLFGVSGGVESTENGKQENHKFSFMAKNNGFGFFFV